MKSAISVSLLGAALASAAITHAQSTFELSNKKVAYALDAPILDWTGSRLAGPQWRVEVYGGPTVDSLTPLTSWDDQAYRFIMPLIAPGYFRNEHGHGAPVVPAVPAGGWAWLQVKAWDVNLGTTYEVASSQGLGGYGASAPFFARGGNAYGLELPQALLGLQSFSVPQEIPEPSTYALMFTGIGSLCWLCRRKA